MTENTSEFIKNLQNLRSLVREVNDMEEPDIDRLIPIVEKGTQSYKTMMSRIEEVEKILGISKEE